LYWDVESKEGLLESWNERWNEAIALDCGTTISILEVQRQILENNSHDLFSECEKGWTHWDLFADNILFKDDRVTAILDFDRMNYVYPEFDISRPILSCCINQNQLDLECASAFVSGYREFKALSSEKLVRSIKLTWWREAQWVRVEKPGDSNPLKRFREENVWIGENWDVLEDLFFKI
jgi:homoserine kinase type II